MSAVQSISEEQLKRRANDFINDRFIKLCRKRIAKIMDRAAPEYFIEKDSNCIKLIYSDEVRRSVKTYEEQISDRVKNHYSDIVNKINY